MNKREKLTLIFLLFSGILYYLMTFSLPLAGGGASLVAIVFSPISLLISWVLTGIYVLLVKKTNFVFVTELFIVLGTILIGLTLLTFPYG